MSTDPRLSLVVVNWRTPDDLTRCLNSIEEYAPPFEHTVTVVNVEPLEGDSAAASMFVDRLEGWDSLEFATNVGYNRACNTAGSKTSAEVIGLLNADVVLRPGALEDLIFALQTMPDWGMIGPRQVNGRGRLTAAGIFGTHGAPKHRGWQESGELYKDVRDDCVIVAGSAFFIKRNLWERLTDCPLHQQAFPGAAGPMGETFGYWGESWCCYHAHIHGWRSAYLGTTTIEHEWHRASPRNGPHERAMDADRALFRRACDLHGIDHD